VGAPRVIQDDLSLRKPALRISTIVYGRENRGRKVYYLVDPRGLGSEKAIAEEVVLKRWRKRVFPNYTFHGDRLMPHCWQALHLLLDDLPRARWADLTQEQIRDHIAKKSESLGNRKRSLPAANSIHALIQLCGVDRLQQIIDRHVAAVDGDPYGTPDLFLFACDLSGKNLMGRFVEVKRPNEDFGDTQRPEIAFLNDLGLHARVVRLIERDSPSLEAGRSSD